MSKVVSFLKRSGYPVISQEQINQVKMVRNDAASNKVNILWQQIGPKKVYD
jgi:hypothetical protein